MRTKLGVEDSGARTGNPRDAWGTITEHDLTEGAAMRILIAEDSLTQAEDLRRRLESLGHKVTVADNGRQAWELLQARPVRVAILDWLMPQMNGVDLCRLIRAEKTLPYVYLILLSASLDPCLRPRD